MPPLSIWFVRTSLVNLLLGTTFGALMLAEKGVSFAPVVWRLRSFHIELLLIGWLLEFGMGVAFWITPRFWARPRRGRTTGAYIAFVLINVGLWLAGASFVFGWSIWWLVFGRILQVAALITFAVHLWPRVVSREG